MKKRGQLIYKALIVVIVVGFIIFFFPFVGKAYGSGESYSKLAVAKDLALLIDTLYAHPGDIYVLYSSDLTDYTIKFYSDEIRVYNSEVGEIDPTAGIYKFVKTDKKIIETEIKNPRIIAFDKNVNEIKIIKLE